VTQQRGSKWKQTVPGTGLEGEKHTAKSAFKQKFRPKYALFMKKKTVNHHIP